MGAGVHTFWCGKLPVSRRNRDLKCRNEFMYFGLTHNWFVRRSFLLCLSMKTLWVDPTWRTTTKNLLAVCRRLYLLFISTRWCKTRLKRLIVMKSACKVWAVLCFTLRMIFKRKNLEINESNSVGIRKNTAITYSMFFREYCCTFNH